MPATTVEGDQLTDQQQRVLDFVFETLLKRGYQPSIREMGEEFGITSPNGIVCHIRALTKKGWIRMEATRGRALTLLRRPDGQPFKGLEFK